jgi:hypothetical protein
MFSRATAVRFAGLALLILGLASMASAQVLNTGAQTINLNAQLAESLTLSLSGNAVSFTLAAGSATNAGNTNITATTKWTLKPGRTRVTVDAYFVDPVNALTDGLGDSIPSSSFFISDNGGTSTALTANTAYGTANGFRLENVSITGANKNSSATDNMAFNIDLSSLGQLAAGTYTGTLNIQAQAAP